MNHHRLVARPAAPTAPTATPPAAAPPPPLPADPQAAIDAFAKAAGLPADADLDTVDQVWVARLEAITKDTSELAPSELAAVRATPGCTPSSFLAAKRTLGR